MFATLETPQECLSHNSGEIFRRNTLCCCSRKVVVQERQHGQKEKREEKACLPQQLYILGEVDAAGATEH